MGVMIDNVGLFNSRLTVVEKEHYSVTVATARNCFLGGLSTVISLGRLCRAKHFVPIAKVTYKKSLSTAEKCAYHEMLVNAFDGPGKDPLKKVLESVFKVIGSADIARDVYFFRG